MTILKLIIFSSISLLSLSNIAFAQLVSPSEETIWVGDGEVTDDWRKLYCSTDNSKAPLFTPGPGNMGQINIEDSFSGLIVEISGGCAALNMSSYSSSTYIIFNTKESKIVTQNGQPIGYYSNSEIYAENFKDNGFDLYFNKFHIKLISNNTIEVKMQYTLNCNDFTGSASFNYNGIYHFKNKKNIP